MVESDLAVHIDRVLGVAVLHVVHEIVIAMLMLEVYRLATWPTGAAVGRPACVA